MEASALRAPAGLTRIALPSALLRLRSDEQLISAFRAGSDEAFGVIHDRYRTRLFAYTRQMLGGSRTDAEDALQDVFLRAYNALRADERPVVLKAWLYRVAHNRCIDQIRRPTPPPADVFEVSRSPMPDPLAEAERRDDLRRLVADVQRLPEHQRSALLMRELEGLSYAELAEALETSVPAVKSLLVRARIGLVEASEARNTACTEIRDDLALSFGKGVRASALARRHMRECQGCSEYRRDLRAVQHGLSALTPAGHPLGLLAKLLGLGGAGGGAAAGAGAGGGAAVVGGGVVAGSAAKVAAVVCCAAITAGGAVELKKHSAAAPDRGRTATPAATERAPAAPHGAHAAEHARRHAAPGAAARSATTEAARKAAAAKVQARVAARERAAAAALAPAADAISPHVADDTATAPAALLDPPADETGGALAPAESDATTPTGSEQPATESGSGSSSSSSSSSGSGTSGSAGDTAAVPVTTAPAGGTPSASASPQPTAQSATAPPSGGAGS